MKEYAKEQAMSLYDNQKCPVCGVPFQEGDDVVTCPECGTPHHRECYKKSGRCANSDLHGSGFVYKRQQPEAQQEELKNEPAAPNPFFGAFPNEKSSAEEPMSDERPVQSPEYNRVPLNEAGRGNQNTAFVFKKNEKIDGVLLSDIVTAVGSNFYKFVSKFKRNKKAGWNWSAFIFGPYYLFFRKMYGPGALFLALEFVGRIVVSFIYSDQISAFTKGAMNLIQNAEISNAEYYSKVNELMTSSGILTAYALVAAVVLVLHLIIGVFADRLYRHKIFNLIADIDKKLEDGAGFASVPAGSLNSREMSQSDMRNLFLAGRGGVSFFAPCVAFLVLSILSDLISYL